MATVAHTASGLYTRAALLSKLLARPARPGTLWQVRDGVFADEWMRETPEALRGLALLRESGAANETEERLGADFERIFAGDAPRVLPLESSYRPGVSAGDLLGIYEDLGFHQLTGLPADHLANELGYFAALGVLAASPEEHLTSFAREHLRPWAGACLAEISQSAATMFYQGVGAIGMDFIESLPTR